MFEIVVILSTVACVLGAAVPELTLPQLDGRIVGGVPTTVEEFPHEVSIQVDSRHLCAGSIIDENHILTAGHCILKFVSTDRYSVRVGSTYWASGGSVHKLASAIVNDKFNIRTLENDIAVLRLATSVEFSDSVKAISLDNADPANGLSARVSGWGTTTEGSSSIPNQLRYAVVDTISNQKCISDYGYGNRIKKNMLCALAPCKDACQGDSGGPLERNGKLIGIVSWGIGCARPEYPGVYTKVASYVDWVQAQINN